MRVLGKLAGGGIGYFLAGPFGALAGIALGHQLFDRPPREFFGIPMSEKEIKNSVFFAAAFSMLGKLAEADGRVSEEERDALKSIIRDKLHLRGAAGEFAYRTFNEAIEDDRPFEEHVHAFHRQFEDAPEALASMLEVMLIVAHADMEYDDSEESMIKLAADIFGLTSEYPSLLALYVNEPDNLLHCYQVLGLQSDASLAEVEAHYQHLLTEHDPEKLLDEGVPKELLAISEEKRRKIEMAYNQIKSASEVTEA